MILRDCPYDSLSLWRISRTCCMQLSCTYRLLEACLLSVQRMPAWPDRKEVGSSSRILSFGGTALHEDIMYSQK